MDAEAGSEPFLPLALAAEHTTRLRLGTAVAVALVRNPLITAHLAHELNRYARPADAGPRDSGRRARDAAVR